MKKLLAVLLAVTMIVCLLAGCAKSGSSETTQSTKASETTGANDATGSSEAAPEGSAAAGTEGTAAESNA